MCKLYITSKQCILALQPIAENRYDTFLNRYILVIHYLHVHVYCKFMIFTCVAEGNSFVIQPKIMNYVEFFANCTDDSIVLCTFREFIDGERKLKRKLIQEREERKLRQSAEEELRGDREYSQAYQRPN